MTATKLLPAVSEDNMRGGTMTSTKLFAGAVVDSRGLLSWAGHSLECLFCGQAILQTASSCAKQVSPSVVPVFLEMLVVGSGSHL